MAHNGYQRAFYWGQPGRRAVTVLLLAIVIFLLAGCADINELNRRTLVSAIGVDQGPTGDEVIVTIVFFSNEPMTQQGAGIGGGGGQEEGGGMDAGGGGDTPTPAVKVTGNGPTVNGALQVIAGKVPGQLFLGSTRLLVFGSELATRGLGTAVDYFARHPHLSAHVATVVAQDTAEKLLSHPSLATPSPGVHLIDTLEEGTREDASLVALPFYKLLDLTFTPWQTHWTALAKEGEIGPESAGGAIFQGERMVRTVTPDDLHFIGAIHRGATTHFPLPPLPGADEPITIRFRTFRVAAQRPKPSDTEIKVIIKGQAFLSEGREITLLGREGALLRQHVNAFLTNQLTSLLRELYSEGIDILDLAEDVRSQTPGGNLPDGWHTRLPQLTFTVESNVHFLHGLRSI